MMLEYPLAWAWSKASLITSPSAWSAEMTFLSTVAPWRTVLCRVREDPSQSRYSFTHAASVLMVMVSAWGVDGGGCIAGEFRRVEWLEIVVCLAIHVHPLLPLRGIVLGVKTLFSKSLRFMVIQMFQTIHGNKGPSISFLAVLRDKVKSAALPILDMLG